MLYLLLAIASWGGVCVSAFNHSLPGMILFGALGFVATYLLRIHLDERARGGGEHTHKHTHEHVHRHDVSVHGSVRQDIHLHGGFGSAPAALPYNGPNPYLPDGTISPFASPEAIADFHRSQHLLASRAGASRPITEVREPRARTLPPQIAAQQPPPAPELIPHGRAPLTIAAGSPAARRLRQVRQEAIDADYEEVPHRSSKPVALLPFRRR